MNSATVDKKTFVNRLATLARLVTGKSYVPILENVCIEIAPDTVTLKSTDFEIREIATIPASTEGNAAVTIPAKMMLKLLRKAPKSADTITLSVDEDDVALDVKVGSLSLHLKGIDAEDFPHMPTVIAETTLHIDAAGFMEALQQVLPATGNDESRVILTGVSFSTYKNTLGLVSADGFRLAIRKLDVKCEGAQLKAIIPGHTLEELARELKGQTESVRVVIGEGFVKFVTETVMIISPLIEGNFPDTSQVVPKECATAIVFQATDLLAALSVIEPISRESCNICRLNADDGSLAVSATSSEMGTASQSIPTDMQGLGGEIAFNIKYLKEAIACVRSETVIMGMNAAAFPGVFRPVGRDDYLHVVMPMNLDR